MKCISLFTFEYYNINKRDIEETVIANLLWTTPDISRLHGSRMRKPKMEYLCAP